jgi:hypothetical protein
MRYGGGLQFIPPAVRKFKIEQAFRDSWTDRDQLARKQLARRLGIDPDNAAS